MADKKYTKADVVKAWSDKAGRQDQYDVREVEGVDGEHQVQLIDKDTGSVSVAANGEGEAAYRKLVEHVGDIAIDAVIMPKESVGPDNNKKHYTSRGQLATPTQPEALVGETEPQEVNPKVETGRVSDGEGDIPTQPEGSTSTRVRVNEG
jgi:hypothetical protein